MSRLLLLILATCSGCTNPSVPAVANAVLPDRMGFGTTIDADTGEVKSYQLNAYWNLRPGK